jgi:hypothetical protein
MQKNCQSLRGNRAHDDRTYRSRVPRDRGLAVIGASTEGEIALPQRRKQWTGKLHHMAPCQRCYDDKQITPNTRAYLAFIEDSRPARQLYLSALSEFGYGYSSPIEGSDNQLFFCADRRLES